MKIGQKPIYGLFTRRPSYIIHELIEVKLNGNNKYWVIHDLTQKLNKRSYELFHQLYHCFTYNIHLPASTCNIIVENCIFLSSNANGCITLPFVKKHKGAFQSQDSVLRHFHVLKTKTKKKQKSEASTTTWLLKHPGLLAF